VAATKKNNWQSSVLQINSFHQQHLNCATDWSAAKGGQVLLHFEHIVSGAATPLCPIAAVFKKSAAVCPSVVG
jgi:hypothetical protein